MWSVLSAALFAQAHTGTGSLSLPTVSNVTASGFTVTWTTSSRLNTQVWYSPHASPPTLRTRLANWTLATSHTATIAGLAAGVTYDVQVESSYFSNPDLVSPVFTITSTGPRALLLQPGSVTLQVGQAQAFTASYSDGSPVGSLTWSASNGGQISSNGVFTATAAGNFTVMADDGAGLTASATVTVTAPTPPSSGLPTPTISNVTATSFTLTWQTSQVLNTQVHFGLLGSNQAFTYADWKLTTNHTAVISGLQAGAAYAVVAESSYYTNPDLFSPGFTVTLGSQPPTRTLGLNPASSTLQVGQTQAFTASYSDGSPVGTLTWSADNGGQISTAGVFTATAAGTFTVTAADSSGLSASAAITVQPASPTGLPVPSISNLTATSFTLTWQTAQALNTQVQYTLAGSSQASRYADWTLTTTHTAIITGLQAGATYSVVAESSYYSNPDLLSPGFTVTLTPLTLSVTAPQTDLGPNQSLDLTALVTNDANAAGVTWSMSPGNTGTLKPSDALHATYTAPASIRQATAITVMATSKADALVTAMVQLTLHPITVTISGVSPTTLYPLQAAELSAILSYDTHHQGVTWSILGNGQGTVGSVDSLTGAYTAPASITAAGTATVVATSVLDPTVSSAPITISYQPPPTAFWQNLVQFENGLARGNSKPYNLLATQTDGNGVPIQWQPDLLIFHDTQNGTEIWRMSNDPSDTYIPGVINRTPWNANGSSIILGSTRNPNQNPYGMTDDWLYDARGGLQVPFTPFDPNRQPSWTQTLAIGNGFLPPDRIDPNIVYAVSYGDNNQGQWQAYHSFIYAINLAPNSNGQRFQSTVVADLPNVTDTVTGVQSAMIRTELRAQLADDDRILLNDFNPSTQPASNDPDGWPKFHLFDGTQVDSVIAANLNADPQNVPRQLPLLDSYSIHFNLTNDVPCAPGVLDTNPVAPCHDVNQEWHLHDFSFQRDSADPIELNYGPRGDVGEYVDFSVPSLYNGDNSTISLVYPDGLTPYYSHPGFSDPGFSDGHKMVVYFGEDVKGSNNYGVWVRDLTTGLPIRQIEKNPPFDSGHSDWSGFDQNYFVFDGWTSQTNHAYDLYEGLSSPTANFASTGKPDRILVHYPPRDPNNTVSILYSPTQSPDATKVAFTIPDSFDPGLNAHQTTFIAVSHRPVPPTLSVSSTSPVTLSWVPYRPHNEVKGYRVYRASSAAASNFTEISNGPVTATTFTDSSAQSGQTYLYAVTAEEYSGLESDQLSNIMQVTVGGASSQTGAAGTTGWDTTAPDPVTQLRVCSLGTNSAGAVVWKVTWTQSDSADVRYTDVYVSLGNPPQATQPYLVDSPPLGTNAYIYWQGDPGIAPQFGITAVDRQGNESTLTIINAAGQSSCP